MARARGYCFTLNNYTDKEYNDLVNVTSRYIILGKEVASTGTNHLQGFIYFDNARSFKSVTKLCPRAHFEVMKGTPSQASTYCKKDNDYYEKGDLPKDKQSINLWNDIQTDIKSGITWSELVEKYPEYAIKYPAGLRNYYDTLKPSYQYSLPEALYAWQHQMFTYLENEPHDRQIIWIYDEEGNSGKTSFANHLITHNNFKVFSNARSADIALAWNGENVIFDYSRSQAEHLNYQILEDIKNGRVFSGKYNSTTKFYKPPHVICLANFKPDLNKLSLDRWVLFEMRSDKHLKSIKV